MCTEQTRQESETERPKAEQKQLGRAMCLVQNDGDALRRSVRSRRLDQGQGNSWTRSEVVSESTETDSAVKLNE